MGSVLIWILALGALVICGRTASVPSLCISARAWPAYRIDVAESCLPYLRAGKGILILDKAIGCQKLLSIPDSLNVIPAPVSPLPSIRKRDSSMGMTENSVPGARFVPISGESSKVAGFA